MGQGRRRRGPALAAVTPRRTGAARAAPGWPPSARVSGRPRSTASPPQGLGDRRCLARAGALLWPAEVEGTPSAGVRDHRSLARAGAPLWPAEVKGAPAAGVGGPPLPATRGAPRSGPPRSTTRRPRGSGTATARHTRAPPIGPAEVARQHAAEKGGEVKNGACHLSRNNA